MGTKEFIALVAKMREAQKLYFKVRTADALNKSKLLEKQVDDAIANIDKPNQGELFK